MSIKEITIVVQHDDSAEQLESRIRGLLGGFPMDLVALSSEGGAIWSCHFAAQDGVHLGFRKVVELQHRLAGDLDIHRVERAPLPAA